MENTIPFVNLNDYQNLQFYSYCEYGVILKAVDIKTQKNVLIKSLSLSFMSDISESFRYLIRYRIASTLNHCGIVKILGFRYPLNSEEKRNSNLLSFNILIKID